jgi:hypothetical protein
MANSRWDIQAGIDRLGFLSGLAHLFGLPTRAGTSSTTGTGVPTNGIAGYVPGALFFNYKGSPGTSLYVNVGTKTSAIWKSLDVGAIQNQPAAQSTFNSSSQTPTYLAANVTGGEQTYLILTGSPGGGVTGTLDTTANILAALNSPAAGYSYVLRVINHGLGQTVTLTAGDGSTTINGTATIATNTWRDFVVAVATASTLTLQSVGIGTES